MIKLVPLKKIIEFIEIANCYIKIQYCHNYSKYFWDSAIKDSKLVKSHKYRNCSLNYSFE